MLGQNECQTTKFVSELKENVDYYKIQSTLPGYFIRKNKKTPYANKERLFITKEGLLKALNEDVDESVQWIKDLIK